MYVKINEVIIDEQWDEYLDDDDRASLEAMQGLDMTCTITNKDELQGVMTRQDLNTCSGSLKDWHDEN